MGGSDTELNTEFFNSANKIKNCGKTFDTDTLLKLYGYYKQAISGDCVEECPSFWQVKEKSKWEACNEHKGLKKTQSMKKYIRLVSKLIE
jgi:acyl-CoA-binding protein